MPVSYRAWERREQNTPDGGRKQAEKWRTRSRKAMENANPDELIRSFNGHLEIGRASRVDGK